MEILWLIFYVIKLLKSGSNLIYQKQASGLKLQGVTWCALESRSNYILEFSYSMELEMDWCIIIVIL
jgi:hypothetical protein